MKVFVCLLAVVACAHASALSSGTSTSSRTQDSAGNYAFAYNEQHSTGGSSRQESGNGWGAQGSYSLNVGDGRQRVVKYVADGAGFRAAIATNEPGTAALPAASTAISSPHAPPAPVQPLPVPALAAPAPIAVAAPVVAAPALPALTNGWNSAPVAIAAPALPALPALAAPALATNGWNSAPVAIAAPVVVKAVPSVSSYSTSINHAVPAAAPVLSGWGAPALAAPAPIVQAPLNGWN